MVIGLLVGLVAQKKNESELKEFLEGSDRR